MNPSELLAAFGKPELMGLQFMILKGLGSVITALVGIVIFFLKKLIKNGEQVAENVAILNEKMAVRDSKDRGIEESHDALSVRLGRVEIEVAVIQREFLPKKSDNGSHKSQKT